VFVVQWRRRKRKKMRANGRESILVGLSRIMSSTLIFSKFLLLTLRLNDTYFVNFFVPYTLML
jgi:hypothetical protein